MWTDHAFTANVAAGLLVDIAADDWGQVEVSYYDTGRLVALAPWLDGHQARVDFLCRRQGPDGSWGGHDGYEVVPTLSVTAALLTELGRVTARGQRKRLARAAVRGVAALRHRWGDRITLPETVGVKLIVPDLLAQLRALTTGARRDPYLADLATDTPQWLRLPTGFDQHLLDRVRERFAGRDFPQRAWSYLEVVGPAAVAAPVIRPAMGAVACSPAATAAWLGGASGDQEALAYLDTLQARGGGPVPPITPITFFEPARVLNSLAIGGLTPAVPAALLERLAGALTPSGAPAAPGLPPDADHTASVLSALARHGRLHQPDVLLDYRGDGYFRHHLDEGAPPVADPPSVGTNAHVLEALALHLTHRPAHRSRFGPAASMAAAWLLDQQQPDGSWWDTWHASPYYATAGCVLALLLHDAAGSRSAIDRAVAWVRETQRADGSWGRWLGTLEETSYALWILAKAAPPVATPAITAGWSYLASAPTASALPADQPALWHAKDLYSPVAVVRAAQLAALALAARRTTASRQRTAAPGPPAGRRSPRR